MPLLSSDINRSETKIASNIYICSMLSECVDYIHMPLLSSDPNESETFIILRVLQPLSLHLPLSKILI
jgi:hypothetical protein